MTKKKKYQDKFGKTNYHRALDDIDNAEETAMIELNKAIDLNNEIIKLLEIVTRGIAKSSGFPEKSPVIIALMTLAVKFGRLQNLQARSKKALEPIETSLELLGVTSEQVLQILKRLDEANENHLQNQINEIFNSD